MIILGCSVFLPLHKDKAVLKILKVSCANTYIDTKDQNYYVSVLTFKTIGKFPATYLWIHILILLVCECLCCYSFTNTMSKTYPHSPITRESQHMSTYSLQVCVFWEFPAHDFLLQGHGKSKWPMWKQRRHEVWQQTVFPDDVWVARGDKTQASGNWRTLNHLLLWNHLTVTESSPPEAGAPPGTHAWSYLTL